MKHTIDKIEVTCNLLKDFAREKSGKPYEAEYVLCDYKTDNIAPTEGYQPLTEETVLKGNDGHCWIKLKLKTPEVKAGKRVLLSVETGSIDRWNPNNPQGMVYLNGEILQALDVNHNEVRLEPATDYELYIYFYFGTTNDKCYMKFDIITADIATEKLYYDMFVPYTACKDVYKQDEFNYSNTLKLLENTCNLLELNYPYTDEFYKSVERAQEYITKEYYEKFCGKESEAVVSCVGHTHIDVAWLWTLAQTREKIQRSGATVAMLMKHYPEYRFMMSQPQLFKFLSEDDPSFYKKVKQLVKDGRWEMEGAMWLEADCNLTSGESLVRQIFHGKRFLKNEFDVDSKVLWLPDVFGYSASIPQILKKSGINYFVTSKISWNDTNMMPYDTFMWQGIDGSEVLTDFITAQGYNKDGGAYNWTTYVGSINASMLAGTWRRYQQKDYNNNVILAYGYGDGGGGPTEEMLEQYRRLSKGLPGLPKAEISTLGSFLNETKKNFEENCNKTGRTPKWIGELYLEYHRGTYTSMAKNKKFNRFCEFLMQRVESSSALVNMLTGAEYKKQEMYDMWETILLNQFHDIIPGSSIKEVYDVSWKQYEQVVNKGEEIERNNLELLAEKVGATDGVLVYNSLGFDRKGIIEYNGKCYETGVIPAGGWKVIDLDEKENSVKINGKTAENDYYILQLDDCGRIVSLFDKRADRQVFEQGKLANEIQIFEDMPFRYDNWELSEYYDSKCKIVDSAVSFEVVNEGDRSGFKVEHKYQNSVLTQYIYLYSNSPRIDIKNKFDWHEHRQIVKLAFPLNVHSGKVTCDIQFGNVERGNNRNTSWDTAKFEMCAQKWVDMSEYGYGVSILNDCKYGLSVKENVIKVSALKSGIYPNPEADQGMHEFTYSILPHIGDFRDASTVKEAYSLNQPLEFVPVKPVSGNLPDRYGFIGTDSENIIIETIKQCEDSTDLIVRFYDAFNCKSKPVIKFGFDVEKVEICDLMEYSLKELAVTDNSVSLDVSNFEIITLKVKRK